MIAGGVVTTVFGVLWIVAFYLSQSRFPIPFLGSWNILVGVILVIAGAVLLFSGVRAPGPSTTVSAAAGSTNNLAIAAFVLAFVAALPAVICGHIALGQIQRTGQSGRGLAIASLWLGYFVLVFAIVAVSTYVGMF